MGRRKIEIEFIREDRSRATTFIKRKSGLFKKAHELAVLTGAQVAVVVFSQQDRLFTYSNEPCSLICSKYLNTPDAYESKGPQDFATIQDHDDDSDDDGASQDGLVRKGSFTTQALSKQQQPSIGGSIEGTKAETRKNSVQLSPRMQSPRIVTPHQHQGEFPTATSPASTSSSRKRGQSPVIEHRSTSPKYIKHEQVSRDVSDVRNSPHHHPRSQNGSRQSIATPPTVQSQDFSMHMSAPMNPPHPSQIYPQMQGPPAGYMPHPHMQQQARIQTPHQMGLQHNTQGQQGGPQYSNPIYSASGSIRQLPMAPPLAIPANGPLQGAKGPTTGAQSQSQEIQRNAQPLLPPNNSNLSRILLPGEGSSGLTPTDSPSNFATNLYSSSGLSGIGTNVSIPRISTDVGSLFYNWNTNEPGLSPATSMMLNHQFREPQDGSGTGNPDQGAGPGRSQLSGPPISAGVLENFSPTTAQWLSGHGIPPAQSDAGRPYG